MGYLSEAAAEKILRPEIMTKAGFPEAKES
jgi:hypothetical protein